MFVETGTSLGDIPSIAVGDTASSLGRLIINLARTPSQLLAFPAGLRQIRNERQISQALHDVAEQVHAGWDMTLPAGGGKIWPERKHLQGDLNTLSDVKAQSLSPALQAIMDRANTLKTLPDQLSSIKNHVAAKPQPKGRLAYITHVSYPEALSGYTRRSDAITNALRSKGLDVFHLSSHSFRDQAIREPAELNLVERIQHAAHLLADALPADTACVLAASDWTNGWVAKLAAAKRNLPFAYEIRGAWELTHTAHRPDYRQSQAFAARYELEKRLCSVSEIVFAQTSQLASYYGLSEAIELIPNGVEKTVSIEPPETENLELGYVGSLVAYEGLEVALRALKLLNRDDINLSIIGDGPCKILLEQQVKSLGLLHHVTILGSRPSAEAKAAIEKCHAIILPRQNKEVCQMVEPLKSVEALAHSRPVLASPIAPVDYPGVWTASDFSVNALSVLFARAASQKTELKISGNQGRDWVEASRLWSDVVTPISNWAKPYLTP